jgi:cytochrome P450
VGERVVTEDDISQMPYLQAVVKETLRRHGPALLAFPRLATEATKVAGYDIPAGTIVLQHVEAVSMNPEIWEDPLEFRPERFLNETTDFTGTTKATLIPFGVGRRICPGIHIALVHADLIVARLIQAFDWKPVTPGTLLDVSPSYKNDLSADLNYPLAANLQERSFISCSP